MLAPDYIKNLPEEDGWDNAYEFNTDLATNAQEYQIISGGKNGNIAASEGPDAGGPTTDFDCDIVYVEWIVRRLPRRQAELNPWLLNSSEGRPSGRPSYISRISLP